jgi:hypothetical protein
MMKYTCPRCGLTSYNLHDVVEKYCVYCHVFEEDEANAVLLAVPDMRDPDDGGSGSHR